MTTDSRRDEITDILLSSDAPVSASALARRFGVSRQVIVGDIALLRASGMGIVATARGYMLPQGEQGSLHTIACRHTAEQTKDELYAIVDSGCTAVDVIVEHPVYGQLTGLLQLSSRYDVDLFLKSLELPGVLPLSALTDGIHLHTVACPSDACFAHLESRLGELGILMTE